MGRDEERPRGTGSSRVAVGITLLIALVGLAFLPVSCPYCKGGRVIFQSLGRIPCRLCDDRYSVPAFRAAGFLIERVAGRP
jgi:hypothetical protein